MLASVWFRALAEAGEREGEVRGNIGRVGSDAVGVGPNLCLRWVRSV